jgi:hypothetical protein
MTETLADIDALLLRCRTENARSYVVEAIQCYQAGAYRSTIVNVWIAVVFDLIDKIRDLAQAGDGKAIELNAKYETYLAQLNGENEQGVIKALEFERDILSTCRDKLDFFDHQQFRDLQRLQIDRHECAHPSFQKPGIPFRPSAEQARLHLRNAVVHVLSMPPVQGRAAIAELVSKVGSAYFPSEQERAVQVLRYSPLGSATGALVRGFIDALVFGYIDPASHLFGKQQVVSALNATIEMHRAIAEKRLASQLNKLVGDVPDHDFPQLAVLLASSPISLYLIDPHARIRVTEFVKAGPEADVIRSISGIGSHPEIAPIARKRIQEFELDRLAEGITIYGLAELAKERALELLSEAGNWTRANNVFAKAVLPLFDMLTREDVERIVRMPTETKADLPGATGYRLFIEQVRRDQIIPEVELNKLLIDNGAGYLVPQEEDTV